MGTNEAAFATRDRGSARRRYPPGTPPMLTIDPNHLGVAEGDRVLDVGCGEGRHLRGVHTHADVRSVGLDLDAERLVATREGFAELAAMDAMAGGGAEESADQDDAAPRTDVVRGDALSLPFPDDAFDVVICSEVLKHLPAYERAIAEFDRVLRPGGRLGVSVPRYGPERLCWALSSGYRGAEGGHVRIFRRGQLREALAAGGFSVVDSTHAHALHSPYWWLQCLVWARKERSRLVAAYERFLEWVLLNDTPVVDRIEGLLDPLFGKSLVFYCEKGVT